nr:uncharacterized protein LOC106623402 [Bactrocera oleae]
MYDCTTATGGIGAVTVGGVIGDNAACALSGGGGGPQGAVDKPFLLQDGRVGLRASLDKAWYTHGEDVCVTVNIKNDSRKTVRKVRVCAIQHVDVCMFNNGKFKNIVADSDNSTPVDHTVAPGSTLNTTVILKPQRGQTKNWIALEDTLQRNTEPEEITGSIAASAVRSPNLILAPGQSINPCPSPAVGIPQPSGYHGHGVSGVVGDDRNVFAIYVSYYVKVKLTLSGMGGELSLKLPFVLVHVEEPKVEHKVERLELDDVPAGKRNGNKIKDGAITSTAGITATTSRKDGNGRLNTHLQQLDGIESIDNEIRLPIPETAVPTTAPAAICKPKLLCSETLAKGLNEEIEKQTEEETRKATLSTEESLPNEGEELQQVHIVQIHSQLAQSAEKETVESQEEDVNKEAKQIFELMEPEEDIKQILQDEPTNDEIEEEEGEKVESAVEKTSNEHHPHLSDV